MLNLSNVDSAEISTVAGGYLPIFLIEFALEMQALFSYHSNWVYRHKQAVLLFETSGSFLDMQACTYNANDRNASLQ